MRSSYSLPCYANSLSPTLSLSSPRRFTVPHRRPCIGSVAAPSCFGQTRLSCSQIHRRTHLPALHSTAMQEIETSQTESELIEVGYISGVHGLQGEVRVKTSTDFPELRFSKPGSRWLRQQVYGRETIEEVELVEGREHPGKKSWIVRFNKVDTVDLAQRLVGSTILVTEKDRPELDEGEFYTHDLVGMKVLLKETGEPVGTVVNVFDTGASDLLHVRLHSSMDANNGNGKPKSESDADASGPLVWVPFVEAIVPDVDMNKREMQITPPKGLLDLNIHAHEKSKKERRQLEWKQRKKFQQRLIAAKKKLHDMEQQHVFHGFRFGEKASRSLLANQIVDVNSILLQKALQNIGITSKRWNLPEFFRANLTNQMLNTMKISQKCLATGTGEALNANSKLLEKGHLLTSEGKVAIVLVVDDNGKLGSGSEPNFVESEIAEDSSCLLVKAFLGDNQRLVKIENRVSVPLILVCPNHAICSLQKLFSNHDHFAFDSQKIWFLEEEKLPVVCSLPEEQNKYKILMKSPWEILQIPVGSGGVISLLSSQNILENLSEMGVEYIEVCNVNQKYVGGHTLLGLVNSCEANVGIQLINGIDNFEENVDMIFSMKFMKQLTKQINNLQFHAIPKANRHVEMVDEEWVDVDPTSANSYELRCSLHSSLNACPSSKVCVVEITD